jgi:hypothetical protein
MSLPDGTFQTFLTNHPEAILVLEEHVQDSVFPLPRCQTDAKVRQKLVFVTDVSDIKA